MSPSDKARRIRVYVRKDGQPVAPIDGHTLEVYGKEKVRLVIYRGPHSMYQATMRALGDAGLYGGATCLCLPHGAEFEVWEEP